MFFSPRFTITRANLYDCIAKSMRPCPFISFTINRWPLENAKRPNGVSIYLAKSAFYDLQIDETSK